LGEIANTKFRTVTVEKEGSASEMRGDERRPGKDVGDKICCSAGAGSAETI
jgi:hypothetical protein